MIDGYSNLTKWLKHCMFKNKNILKPIIYGKPREILVWNDLFKGNKAPAINLENSFHF